MINLTFSAQRKIIRLIVEGKTIKYFDDNWKDGIQFMPSQTPEMKLMLKKMMLSRKSSISAMGLLIVDANSGKNKEEYDKCETEKDIARLIRRDCELKGLVEVK